MAVSYDRLWKHLIDRKMTRTDLKYAAGISFNILAKMGRNEFVSMESIYKICAALNCRIEDIMEFDIEAPLQDHPPHTGDDHEKPHDTSIQRTECL